ncbi:Signal transduction histidine kinase [Curtobacterium sp. 9128]|uniref:sensor histidine kinase n=1 Tax=Curtobacterium sp. 9128 TaxID=1793722 RepID=UPI0007D711F5|nr:HAMP domain-containing sensor histidine kinase [Curtobacterium sp. 9128]SBN63421.1 Signal transduction histidine kinase [Curtobacterium sp. 9128]
MNGEAPSASVLRTGSLRMRTVVAVLVLLAVLLGALGVVVQATLGDRLRAQVEDRLRDRASAAAALVGTVDAADLADRLSMQGLSVTITAADGGSVEAGPSPDQLRHGPPDPGTLPAPAAAPARDSTADPSTTGTGATSHVTIRSSRLTEGDRIVTLVSTLSDGSRIRLTAGTGPVDEVLGELRWVMLAASVGFMLVAAVGLVIVVRRTMRPLDVMTDAARSIAHGDRGRRLRPARQGTEIGRVAVAFDEMLDAVEGAERHAVSAEARMRSFLSDAAHELRTPVAGITAAADTLVRARPDVVEREELAVHVVRQAGRAARLVDDLLLMARVDGGLALEPASVDLGAIARSEADRSRLRSPGLTVQVAETDGAVVVSADGDRIGQVLANLLANAARATDGAGHVVVEIDRLGDVGRVRVADDGPGIPAVDRARVFDRLVRLDAARAASGGGAGLGLPIARGIARAHGGDLVCAPGVGTVFVLTIPATTDQHTPTGQGGLQPISLPTGGCGIVT